MRMTDNNSKYCDNISEKLAFYVALIRQENSKNMQTRNIRAEGFFAAFLNALKGWRLINANDERHNAPGIDLIDRDSRVIVQVSSTFDRDKLLDALKKSDIQKYQGYHFYFMAITERAKSYAPFPPAVWIVFNQKQDIYDTGRLLEMAQGVGIERQKVLSDLVNQYFEADIRASVRCLTRMPPRADKTNVICRDRELEDVRRMLDEGQDVMLMSGFGGIGKTALARLVFHSVKGFYDEVAWVPYNGSLRRSLLASIELDGDIRDEAERLRRINALRNDGLRKLFVIDNADAGGEQNPQEDAGLAALSGWEHTTVLVTSRLDELEPFKLYRIDFLGDDPCVDLFFHYYDPEKTKDPNRTQDDAVRRLVALALNHTLTVELFAKGAKRAAGLDAYYKTLRANLASVPRRFAIGRTGKMDTVVGHLRGLFDLQDRTDAEKNTLRAFALLPPAAALTPEEAEAWFGLRASDLERLADDGWLQWKGGSYFEHPLVRQIILLDPIPEDTAGHFLDFIEDYHNGYFADGAVHTELTRRLELAEAAVEAVCRDGDTVQIAHILHNMGGACQRLARYGDAVRHYQKALAIKEVKRGKNHTDTATIYNNLALVYDDMGDYPKALEYHEKARKIREAVLGPEHPDTATTYNNLANVYQAMGDYPKALEYYEKTRKIDEAVNGPEHPFTATTYNNLGALYYAMERWFDADDYLLRALKIRLVKLGPGHPNTKNTYGWLSDSYQAQHGETGSFLPWLRAQLNAEENRALDELLKE